MRGPSWQRRKVAPHQLGRMTYGPARLMLFSRAVGQAVSHGLASSPPRGEAFTACGLLAGGAAARAGEGFLETQHLGFDRVRWDRRRLANHHLHGAVELHDA